MHPTLTIAKRAALSAAKIITRGFDQLEKVQVNSKNDNDFVTNIDLAVEQDVVKIIRESYPDHDILSEEAGNVFANKVERSSEYLWIIDPLDGTTNFTKGFPHFAISIALFKNDKPEIGLVFNPINNEMFMAAKGQGATLNDRKVRANSVVLPENAVIATGFPFKNTELMPKQQAVLRNVLTVFPDIRRTGSAALDLCYVASGRVDGYFELGLSIWDIAAGVLVAQESGVIISDFNGDMSHLNSGNVVAAPQKVYKELIKATRKTTTY